MAYNRKFEEIQSGQRNNKWIKYEAGTGWTPILYIVEETYFQFEIYVFMKPTEVLPIIFALPLFKTGTCVSNFQASFFLSPLLK